MRRWPARTIVDTLIRRTAQAGGFAAIIHRGDDDSGAIALDCRERGAAAGVLEFAHGPDAQWLWRPIDPPAVPAEASADPRAAPLVGDVQAAYLARRRRTDPDLWVIELDIAQPEQFVAALSQ